MAPEVAVALVVVAEPAAEAAMAGVADNAPNVLQVKMVETNTFTKCRRPRCFNPKIENESTSTFVDVLFLFRKLIVNGIHQV